MILIGLISAVLAVVVWRAILVPVARLAELSEDLAGAARESGAGGRDSSRRLSPTQSLSPSACAAALSTPR